MYLKTGIVIKVQFKIKLKQEIFHIIHLPCNEHKQMYLFASYCNNLFFHAHRRVVFYLMFAFNRYLMELLLAYFIYVNGNILFIYDSFNCATSETR